MLLGSNFTVERVFLLSTVINKYKFYIGSNLGNIWDTVNLKFLALMTWGWEALEDPYF